MRKTEVGIPKTCENTGVNMCNPILQAKILNAEPTDLNIVMGLCVGLTVCFTKYSEGLTDYFGSKGSRAWAQSGSSIVCSRWLLSRKIISGEIERRFLM